MGPEFRFGRTQKCWELDLHRRGNRGVAEAHIDLHRLPSRRKLRAKDHPIAPARMVSMHVKLA